MPILCSWLNIDYNNVISISDLSIKLQKQHLFNSLLALITFNESEISEAPMLLVVEDIHWADATTIEFIDFLMSKAVVRKTKCKVILSSRFSSSQRFTSNDLIELKLKCLTVAESSILVEELFGQEKLSDRLLYEITSRTGGVPYFIEEFISMLTSEGLVKVLNGCADFVADVNISAVPDTLRGSLQQKIERLKHSKDTAQLSSVIGREFSLELLVLVSRKPKQQLNNDLKELVNKGVIYKKRLTYADVYVFKHALVKDAVYESILESMRIVFHKQVASILLESFDHEMMKSPAVLARHWELAECSSLSARWYLKAAKRSEERFLLEESIVYFNKVLSLFKENGVGEDSGKYFDPYFGLGNAYENIGEYKKSRLNYQKSISTGGVYIGKVTAYLKLGKTWEVTHQFKLALEEYEQAEFVLKSLGLDEHGDIWIDEWLKIQSAKLGVNYWRGNIENMNGYIEKIESLVMSRGNSQQKSRYFTDILQLSVRRKRYRLDPDDTEIAKKSLSYANQTNDISLQAFGCFALGFTLYFNDLFLESIAELEYGLVKFERSNSVASKCRFTIYMSIAYRRCMDVENTKKYAVTALNLATKAARQDYVAAANANLAWVAYKSNEDIRSMELIKLSKHLWESIKDEYPFPFQWLSLIIELELLVNDNIKKGGWQDEIVRIATALMSESQQILPALINKNLETFLCCYSKKGVFIKSYLIDSLKEAKRTTFL
jgi:tetratricopeptide (TPR) repeat protein